MGSLWGRIWIRHHQVITTLNRGFKTCREILVKHIGENTHIHSLLCCSLCTVSAKNLCVFPLCSTAKLANWSWNTQGKQLPLASSDTAFYPPPFLEHSSEMVNTELHLVVRGSQLEFKQWQECWHVAPSSSHFMQESKKEPSSFENPWPISHPVSQSSILSCLDLSKGNEPRSVPVFVQQE